MLHFLFQSAETFLQCNDLTPRSEQLPVNGIAAGNRIVLCQIAGRRTFCKNCLALVRLHLFHDDFQQRRLSGTIDADDRCFFALLDVEGNIF